MGEEIYILLTVENDSGKMKQASVLDNGIE